MVPNLAMECGGRSRKQTVQFSEGIAGASTKVCRNRHLSTVTSHGGLWQRLSASGGSRAEVRCHERAPNYVLWNHGLLGPRDDPGGTLISWTLCSVWDTRGFSISSEESSMCFVAGSFMKGLKYGAR